MIMYSKKYKEPIWALLTSVSLAILWLTLHFQEHPIALYILGALVLFTTYRTYVMAREFITTQLIWTVGIALGVILYAVIAKDFALARLAASMYWLMLIFNSIASNFKAK